MFAPGGSVDTITDGNPMNRLRPSRIAPRWIRLFAGLAAVLVTLTTIAYSTPAAAAAPVTIWGWDAPDDSATADDRDAVELGTRFTVNEDGFATGVRFYKADENTGVHTGTLWSSSGAELASVTFTNESRSGWQQAKFEDPVELSAGDSYVVSYFAPRGRYSYTQYFNGDPVSALFDTSSRSGVYRYGSDSGFPRSTWRSSQYWVDVTFEEDAGAPAPTPPRTPTVPPPPTPAPPAPPPPPPPPTRTPTATPTPTPTPTVTPTPTQPAGGTVVLGRSFPNASTTGVPAGTALTAYTGSCTIQTNDVKIDGKIINCDMRILAQRITITNSVLNGTIYSDPDYFDGSFTMTDSEVRMPLRTGTGVGETNFTLTRVEVTGGSRSVNCASNCTVQDSFLHGQYTDLRGIDHESAIRMGSDSKILRNHITCDSTPVPPDAGCSAALTGYGDFAIVQRNTIQGNLIDGGPFGSMGYCAYGGSTTGKPFSAGVNNIQFKDNIFRRGPNGKCGIWGPITSFDSRAPGNVWTNNLWDDGATVQAAN